MGILNDIGIVVGDKSMAAEVFDNLHGDFRLLKYSSASDYIKHYWESYQKYSMRNNNLNGKIFEYMLATLLYREGIKPFYLEAKMAFVPNANFDLLLYSQERGPICLSAKTSLRERYKQADLESIALKQVHRRALCYLVTLSEKEATSVKRKIKKGEIVGLDKVVVATSPEFDDLIQDLKSNYSYYSPQPVEVITAFRRVD